MSTSQLSTIIWFAILIAIFYFLLIRPQQQRARKHKELVSSLKTGDKVVTMGGIYGTIKSLKKDTVVLDVGKDVRITVSKSSIGRKQEKGSEK